MIENEVTRRMAHSTQPQQHPDTSPGTRVAFRTVGCRLNQCETAQMQESVLGAGFRLVEWNDTADVRVVNTCTVTAKSDRTCRHEIRVAKRLDPDCTVVVTGCYAQIAPDTVAAIPGVDLVLGNIDKLRLVDHLHERQTAGQRNPGREPASPTKQDYASEPESGREPPAGAGRKTGASDPASDPPSDPVVSVTPYPDRLAFEGEFFTQFHGYTRAFLKIQTGCDSGCAYCVIPLARGPARSMPRAQALEQVRLLTARGYGEVVLTGVDLGSWGRDTREGSLAALLDLLLTDVPSEGVPLGRLRLSSIEPLEISPALLDVVERHGDRVARHFHLPMQSGSDSVLTRMDRPYRAAGYLEVIETIARRFPDAAVGADVIVGFPGETDAEFQETMDLVERSPLTYLHVFAYSDRPGTRASAMKPKVHPETIHERSQRLRALGTHKKDSFRGRLVGTEQRVLVLNERAADGRPVGLTGNYAEVLVDDETLVNRFARLRLEQITSEGRFDTVLLETEPRP